MEKPGILLLHKPLGVRSTSCVSLVKRLGGGKLKVGHAGTLDSTAEGLLAILLGKATRLSRYIMHFPKKYAVTVQFGVVTSTDDASGEILERHFLPSPDDLEARVDCILPSFLGTRMQRPPAISAVHVEGKRAHALARSGENPHIEAKPVSFYSLRRTSGADAEGRISFEILCSKGTYIRSFARDMGEKLSLGGHSVALCRQSIGAWTLHRDALPFQALEERRGCDNGENVAWLASVCRSPLEVARHYSVFSCSGEMEEPLRNGNPVSFRELCRESWGSLSFQDSLVVRLSEDLVFGNLEPLSENGALFLPKTRIPLGEDA